MPERKSLRKWKREQTAFNDYNQTKLETLPEKPQRESENNNGTRKNKPKRKRERRKARRV